MSTRPSFDDLLMSTAKLWAGRATCDRAHVGCVIAQGPHPVAIGYNGSVPGADHCDDAGHLMVDNHCVRTVHAEANAVATAARLGVGLMGATAYMTHSPCPTCAGVLFSAGVRRFVVAKSGIRPDWSHSLEKLWGGGKPLIAFEVHDDR